MERRLYRPLDASLARAKWLKENQHSNKKTEIEDEKKLMLLLNTGMKILQGPIMYSRVSSSSCLRALCLHAHTMQPVCQKANQWAPLRDLPHSVPDKWQTDSTVKSTEWIGDKHGLEFRPWIMSAHLVGKSLCLIHSYFTGKRRMTEERILRFRVPTKILSMLSITILDLLWT